MLFGFEAKSDENLERFIVDFQDPPGTVARITNMWLYGNIRVYRFDDVVIFKTNGLLEFLGMRMSILMFMAYVVGWILNLDGLRSFALPFMLVCFLFFLPDYHVRITISKLKRYGFKGKINILGYMRIKSRYDYVAARSFEDS